MIFVIQECLSSIRGMHKHLTHEFKRNLRQLARKYRRIQKDIRTTLSDLQAGNLPGDQIPGVSFEIYKVRARNSDSLKGKSGGYKIIDQRTHANTIILLTIASYAVPVSPRSCPYHARQRRS